jgi:hypothetical protein
VRAFESCGDFASLAEVEIETQALNLCQRESFVAVAAAS